MRYFTNRDLTLIGIIAAIGQGFGFLLGMPIRATPGIPFLVDTGWQILPGFY